MSEEEIKFGLRKLIRAITLNNSKNQMRWHKALYKIGRPALPKIYSTIESYQSSNLDRRTKLLCVSGLMQLLHDIDENEAEILTEQLIQSGCDSIISNRLKSINVFTLNNFVRYQINGVTIFEEKKLSPAYSIRLLLQKWFENVPDEDVKEVDRIYIVKLDNQEYAGNYMPIFFSINLVWSTPSSRYNPLFWLLILFIEQTFYHEVGHHVHRHTFGQDPEQEKEANRYSSMLIAARHPLLGSIIGIISKFFRKAAIKKSLKKINHDTTTSP